MLFTLYQLWETADIIEDRPDLDDYRQSCSNLYGDVPEQPVEGTHTYAKRRVSELLAEQIECADMVVLTKVEHVPLEQFDYIRALLHCLNPRSSVMVLEFDGASLPHLARRVWIESRCKLTVADDTMNDRVAELPPSPDLDAKASVSTFGSVHGDWPPSPPADVRSISVVAAARIRVHKLTA